MDLETKKLDLIEWIAKLNDEELIAKLSEIQKAHAASLDWSDDLHKEEIASIERGLKDMQEGKVHDHESARKIYEKFL